MSLNHPLKLMDTPSLIPIIHFRMKTDMIHICDTNMQNENTGGHFHIKYLNEPPYKEILTGHFHGSGVNSPFMCVSTMPQFLL
jgi:hypothetical protein